MRRNILKKLPLQPLKNLSETDLSKTLIKNVIFSKGDIPTKYYLLYYITLNYEISSTGLTYCRTSNSQDW